MAKWLTKRDGEILEQLWAYLAQSHSDTVFDFCQRANNDRNELNAALV